MTMNDSKQTKRQVPNALTEWLGKKSKQEIAGMERTRARID